MSAGAQGPGTPNVPVHDDPAFIASATAVPAFDGPDARGADFKDHFSAVADAYAAARPEYPDALFDTLAAFRARIGPHWPPERTQVDAQYAGYDWPFPALPAPGLWLEADWSLARFLRYLASLSASARCLAESGDDPVARHAPMLAAAWGGDGDVRTLQWPLFLHLRRKP